MYTDVGDTTSINTSVDFSMKSRFGDEKDTVILFESINTIHVLFQFVCQGLRNMNCPLATLGFRCCHQVFPLELCIGLIDTVVAFPSLKKFVDDTYETQKYRFYEKAKSNPYYNHTLMSDRTLEMEVSMKRAFGILLCSDEDEQLQKMLSDEFVKVFPRIKPLMEKFVWTAFQKVVQNYMQDAQKKNMTDDELSGVVFFVAYELMHKYGLDCEDKEIQQLFSMVEKDVTGRARYAQSPFVERIDALKVHDMVVVPRHVRKTKETITTGNHLTAFTEWTNVMASGDPHQSKTAIKSFYTGLLLNRLLQNLIL